MTLSFAEIDWIAFHCEGYSSWCSKTIRTARSRNSAGYGGRGARLLSVLSDTAPSSQRKEQSPIPGRFNLPHHSGFFLGRELALLEELSDLPVGFFDPSA